MSGDDCAIATRERGPVQDEVDQNNERGRRDGDLSEVFLGDVGRVVLLGFSRDTSRNIISLLPRDPMDR